MQKGCGGSSGLACAVTCILNSTANTGRGGGPELCCWITLGPAVNACTVDSTAGVKSCAEPKGAEACWRVGTGPDLAASYVNGTGGTESGNCNVGVLPEGVKPFFMFACWLRKHLPLLTCRLSPSDRLRLTGISNSVR